MSENPKHDAFARSLVRWMLIASTILLIVLGPYAAGYLNGKRAGKEAAWDQLLGTLREMKP